MTWVNGAATILGHGIMVSDVRVTFADKSEADLLRKCYPVGPYIMAGFSGSVRIGMKLLKNLEKSLEPHAKDSGAWVPEAVAKRWSSDAATIFANSANEERKLGAQILLVGITPERTLPKIPHVSLITLKGPTFKPKYVRYAENTGEVAQIGSGSAVKIYGELMQDFIKINGHVVSGNTQSLSYDLGIWAAMFSEFTRKRLAKETISGVSPHLHIQMSQLGEFAIARNDGSGEDSTFKMPQVASTYEEFDKLCKTRGLSAAGAIA